jgi:hypothetical protein
LLSPKQKAHSRLVSGLQENFLNYYCRYVTRQMCRTKTIEQHELFEHIIGIWRSAVIERRIVTS